MGLRSLIIYLFFLILDVGAGVWCLLEAMYWGAGAAVAVMLFLVYMLISVYSSNLDKLNYLLGAFENGCWRSTSLRRQVSEGQGIQYPSEQGKAVCLGPAAAEKRQ